jgi:hypothetical protein
MSPLIGSELGSARITGIPEVEPQLAMTGVGVEKVDIHKNGVIFGDRKCLGDPRKSFVGHPDAT